MKVAIINGSPRKSGNSSYLCSELEEMYAGDVFRVELKDLEMKGCQSCYVCRKQDRMCVVDDDVSPILNSLLETDLIILVTPNYYGHVTGQMKLFLDRWYCLKDANRRNKLDEKAKLFFLVVQGAPNRDHGQRMVDWAKRFSEGYGVTFYHYIVAGCQQETTDMARMKFDDIRLHLNMFI